MFQCASRQGHLRGALVVAEDPVVSDLGEGRWKDMQGESTDELDAGQRHFWGRIKNSVKRRRSSVRAWRFGSEGLTPAGSGAMLDFGGCVGTVVDFDVDMNEVLIIGPERVLQTTPVVYFGEAPRAAASFDEAAPHERSDCAGEP